MRKHICCTFVTQNIREVDASAQKEVVLPNGLRYTDLRVGGGQMPTKGYLVRAVTEYTTWWSDT